VVGSKDRKRDTVVIKKMDNILNHLNRLREEISEHSGPKTRKVQVFKVKEKKLGKK